MGICGALPGHADKFFSNKIVLLGEGHYANYDCKCNTTGTCPEMHDNQIYVQVMFIVVAALVLCRSVCSPHLIQFSQNYRQYGLWIVCRVVNFPLPAGRHSNSARPRESTQVQLRTSCHLMTRLSCGPESCSIFRSAPTPATLTRRPLALHKSCMRRRAYLVVIRRMTYFGNKRYYN